MFSDTTLLINIACISFLVIMLIILLTATRMKGRGVWWAAVIIVMTTVPMYLKDLMRDYLDYYMLLLYLASFFISLLMPSLWFFAHSQMDKSFRLTARSLLHTIPAFVSLIVTFLYYYHALLSAEQVNVEWVFVKTREICLIINFCQFFIYSIALFFYCRKRLKYLDDNYSDSDRVEIKWTLQFLFLFFLAFLTLFLVYIINPRITEGLFSWLSPILNVGLMAYLVYIIISHSSALYLNRLPDAPADSSEQDNGNGNEKSYNFVGMSAEQMKNICDKVIEYLRNSQAYINPDFSISMLSQETGLHQRNISLAINGYLHRNFFSFVNEMRVDEAKRLLRNQDYTVDGVYPECGFRSRTSFYIMFRKIEGTTPAQWQKNNNT